MDDEEECPLCVNAFTEEDLRLEICSCPYLICGFCYNTIKEQGNGLCPGCRQKYSDEPRIRAFLPKCVAPGPAGAPRSPALPAHAPSHTCTRTRTRPREQEKGAQARGAAGRRRRTRRAG